MEERHVSLSTVAGQLGVSERTVRRWIKAGKLRAYRPGRDFRIPESALKEFVEESEVSPKVGGSSPELSLFNGADEPPSVAVDGLFSLLERWYERRLAEVNDPTSLHFRDATSAALWIADSREEASDFCLFLADWIEEHRE